MVRMKCYFDLIVCALVNFVAYKQNYQQSYTRSHPDMVGCCGFQVLIITASKLLFDDRTKMVQLFVLVFLVANPSKKMVSLHRLA